MITTSDSYTTVDCGDHYAILPPGKDLAQYCEQTGAKPIPLGFSYSSGENDRFLTVEELRVLIRRHVDSGFTVSGLKR
jgi:hypothetical protein